MTTANKRLKPLQRLKDRLQLASVKTQTANHASASDKPSGENIGVIAERAALTYLQSQGLKKVQRNYFSRCGEIDLIMTEAQTLVFIEVRYRKYNTFGSAAMTVTQSKQQKLINTAKHYLQKHQANVECRFDVIDMSPASAAAKQQHGLPFDINWIKNAFM